MLATSGDATGPSVVFNAEQASGGSVGTYKGRKFATKEKVTTTTANETRLKIPKNVNLEGLHLAMEEDSTAVDVLKREVRWCRQYHRSIFDLRVAALGCFFCSLLES